MLPVWKALPTEARGSFWMPANLAAKYPDTPNLRTWNRVVPEFKGLCLVASYQDLQLTRDQPAVLMQHGSGQSYRGDKSDRRALEHPSYAGGLDNGNVELFICPAQRVADAWAETYPKTRSAVVGCPKLDQFVEGSPVMAPGPRQEPIAPALPAEQPSTILIAFNWGATLCPETTSARNHFTPALPDLVKAFPGRVIGTGHPRAKMLIQSTYKQAGIPWFDSSNQTLDNWLKTVAVALVDNSSLGWELAALGVPVIWLNAPEYRRNVEHGLRFWSTPAIYCAEPPQLAMVVKEVSVFSGTQRVSHIGGQVAYDGLIDGHASERAAKAILDVL